jgi:hypothetical protein
MTYINFMFIKAKDIRIQGKEPIRCILWRHIANIGNQQKEFTLAYSHPQLSSTDYILFSSSSMTDLEI